MHSFASNQSDFESALNKDLFSLNVYTSVYNHIAIEPKETHRTCVKYIKLLMYELQWKSNTYLMNDFVRYTRNITFASQCMTCIIPLKKVTCLGIIYILQTFILLKLKGNIRR